jgi:hypothetical protein
MITPTHLVGEEKIWLGDDVKHEIKGIGKRPLGGHYRSPSNGS